MIAPFLDAPPAEESADGPAGRLGLEVEIVRPLSVMVGATSGPAPTRPSRAPTAGHRRGGGSHTSVSAPTARHRRRGIALA